MTNAKTELPCIACGTPTTHRVEHEVPDPYGIACSEPELGVPLTMTLLEPCCPKCDDNRCRICDTPIASAELCEKCARDPDADPDAGGDWMARDLGDRR